ncbi:MAG: ethanolamine utilization microcompartment protein EutL [Synergistaceae bacterium]|jgi:ethanolamine utilization protein EutL|nr:ethanolamine utilization microcompartment protein EutL [Synergistaceae bacterium]
MKGERIQVNVLTSKIISNVSEALAKELGLTPEQNSIGFITSDCDDVTYIALDEATKNADVSVVYAKSFYGGAANANTKYAGEIIGIIAGPGPGEVRSGMNTLINFIEHDAAFISANEDDSVAYLAHCVSRTGTFLSKTANVSVGSALAYLIAPPEEAIWGLDAALKAADVTMAAFYGPPSETNFGGGLLTGTQSACKAACSAFANAVVQLADHPRTF